MCIFEVKHGTALSWKIEPPRERVRENSSPNRANQRFRRLPRVLDLRVGLTPGVLLFLKAFRPKHERAAQTGRTRLTESSMSENIDGGESCNWDFIHQPYWLETGSSPAHALVTNKYYRYRTASSHPMPFPCPCQQQDKPLQHPRDACCPKSPPCSPTQDVTKRPQMVSAS